MVAFKGWFSLAKETESESSGNQTDGVRSRTPADSAYDSVAYDQVKTALSESQAEAEEKSNHSARFRAL